LAVGARHDGAPLHPNPWGLFIQSWAGKRDEDADRRGGGMPSAKNLEGDVCRWSRRPQSREAIVFLAQSPPSTAGRAAI